MIKYPRGCDRSTRMIHRGPCSRWSVGSHIGVKAGHAAALDYGIDVVVAHRISVAGREQLIDAGFSNGSDALARWGSWHDRSVIGLILSQLILSQLFLHQALFAADELEVAQRFGQFELEGQITLLQSLSTDILSRLVSRGEKDLEVARVLRQTALSQARLLTDGIKGGVLALAGQVSIANTLRGEEVTGIDYIRSIKANTEAPLVCLVAAK